VSRDTNGFFGVALLCSLLRLTMACTRAFVSLVAVCSLAMQANATSHTCSSYSCPSDMVMRGNVANTTNPNEATCCMAAPTCMSYSCTTRGWIKKAGTYNTTIGYDSAVNEATCCEAYTTTTQPGTPGKSSDAKFQSGCPIVAAMLFMLAALKFL